MITGRVEALKGTNGEGTRLTGSGLSLAKKNAVVSFCFKPFLVNRPNWARSQLQIRGVTAKAFIILFTYAIVSLP